MPNRIVVVLLFFSLSACNIESKLFPKQAIDNGKKIWTFISFNVPQKGGGIEDYYYFGLISENLYQKIKTHEIKDGLLFMEKVKYWNTEDAIESYADELYSDELAFRIEDIVKLELVKTEPVNGFKYADEELIDEVEPINEI